MGVLPKRGVPKTEEVETVFFDRMRLDTPGSELKSRVDPGPGDQRQQCQYNLGCRVPMQHLAHAA